MSHAVLSTLRGTALAVLLIAAAHAAAPNSPMSPTSPAEASTAESGTGASADTTTPAAPVAMDVEKLFANTCGWCHSSAGREAGRGPKLMETTLTDAQIVQRIKQGKPGAMPAFGSAFNDEQINSIVRYIRDLKPQGGE